MFPPFKKKGGGGYEQCYPFMREASFGPTIFPFCSLPSSLWFMTGPLCYTITIQKQFLVSFVIELYALTWINSPVKVLLENVTNFSKARSQMLYSKVLMQQ